MKYKLHLAIILAFMSLNVSGQGNLRHSEFGLGIGTLSGTTDIATTTSVASVLKEIRPNARMYGILHLNDWFGLGADFNYGWIFNDDDNHTNINRGLEVVTTMAQINLFSEINFIRFGKFHRDVKFGLYSKLGAGFTGYNPSLTFTSLQPESITVYPESYTAANYFISFGVKFRTQYKTVLRIETYFHSLAEDNLDGFKLNSVTSVNDAYGGLMISYSMLIF